jgi:sodium-dependent dicarboxylate transporter 2/3/5
MSGAGGLRQTIGLFLGPALFLAVLASPTDLPAAAHRLAAVFALVIVYWVTEAIPLPATALLGPALAIPLGVGPARDVFAPFAHPIIFLFMGSFLIARAMALHRLDRRIALFVLSRRWVADRPRRILLAFGAIAAFLSMWMSNTATTAMMLPIGLGVLGALGPAGGEEMRTGRYATGLMLMIAFSCEAGGIATPVGTPPNLIAIGMIERFVGKEISFFQWMLLGVPVALCAFVIVYFVVSRCFPSDRGRIEGAAESIRRERRAQGPLRAGEKAALAAFCAAVTLWTVPGFLALIRGPEDPLAASLTGAFPEAAAAILAALLLFILPVSWRDRRFALSWGEAVKIDWGTILLFGGGLSLGSLALETGLASALGQALGDLSGFLPVALMVLAAVLIADVLTEFMSNTATANVLVPVFLAVGAAASGNPILLALGATIGCSIAFCLPVATPPNAIVYGTGLVPLTSMIRAGILLDLGCALAAWAILLLVGARF